MTTFKRSDPFRYTFEIPPKHGKSARLNRHASGAAIFNGKALVFPSTCELHPKYQALRPPRSKKAGCTCAEIYSRRNAFDAGR